MNLKFNKALLLIAATTLASVAGAQDKQKVTFKDVFTKPEKLSVAVNDKEAEESLPILSKDGKTLYFVRTYTQEGNGYKVGDQDVFVSVMEKGKWTEASNDLPQINNRFNNAVVGISDDGKRIYLMNQYVDSKKFSSKGVSLTQMGEDGTWEKPKAIVMPNIDFRGKHYGAYVTPDERTILFSANIAGNMGEEDLYYATINEDGKWSEIKSMGGNINTSEADFSPFLSPDGETLFFASYGHNSKGSADIFYAKRLGKGFDQWGEVKAMKGINTKNFEGYAQIDQNKNIIFASNQGKEKYAELYSTKMKLEEIKPEPVEPIQSEEELAVEKLKKQYDLQLLYFDYNKAEVTTEDAIVLDAIHDIMKKFPNLSIILKGHTDTRGSEKYNLRLSEKRVKSAKKYLVEKGVDDKRIYTHAFGESLPKFTEDTEEAHAKNRRVEIDIMSSLTSE